MDDIRRYAGLTEGDEVKVIKDILTLLNAGHERELAEYRKKIRDAERRRENILRSVKQLFDERVAGNLPDSLFKNLMEGYEKERLELEQKISQTQNEVESMERSASDVSQWLGRIRKYMTLDTLDRDSVHDLIESITVSERYKVGKQSNQDVHIKYRFIGELQIPTEKQSRTPPAVTGHALECAQFSAVR
jgi:hypothetical protein